MSIIIFLSLTCMPLMDVLITPDINPKPIHNQLLFSLFLAMSKMEVLLILDVLNPVAQYSGDIPILNEK